MAISLIVDYHTIALVRGLTMQVEVTAMLQNLDPRDVWQQNDTYHNFDMNISLMNGTSNLLSSSAIVDNIAFTYIHGSKDDGVKGMDNTQHLVMFEVI